ncbi:MAG TPA: hypothetical protein VNJ29_02495 [Candidatus Nitrosotenuis sp.]|jgi:hypothetical protein|nr:hypothetical protein [Candidatus Nitrosotenuis sp.]
MLLKLFLMMTSIVISTSILGAENFIERKESYNHHRKEKFRHYITEAKTTGIINPSVEELPSHILTQLKQSKTGEFDRKNKQAIYELMQQITSNSFSDNFSVKELGGGFVSGKIYKVTNHDSNAVYFIKYLRKRTLLVPEGRILGEQANLEAISQNPLLEKYNWRGSLYNFDPLRSSSFHGSGEQFMSTYASNDGIGLKIVLPIKVYEYRFKGSQKIFMVLPGAKGVSLASLIQESLTPNSSPTIQKLSPDSSVKEKHFIPSAGLIVNEAFSKVGTALAQLHVAHRKFKGTMEITEKNKDYFGNLGVFSHGDFHAHNIFIHQNTVSLIDAETTANSFDSNGLPNGPIYYDFFYLMLMTERHFPGVMKAMDWQPFKALFKSYIEAYPKDEQDGLTSYLWHHLKNIKKFSFTDLFEHFSWKKNYSKSTVKGAYNIANYLVKCEYERGDLGVREQFMKKPIISITKMPNTNHKTTVDDELTLLHSPKVMESPNQPKASHVADLIKKHNQFIENAKSSQLHVPGKRVATLISQKK